MNTVEKILVQFNSEMKLLLEKFEIEKKQRQEKGNKQETQDHEANG